MSSALAPFAGVVMAACIQFGALAYWGGRISARLEHVEARLETLDQLTRRHALAA